MSFISIKKKTRGLRSKVKRIEKWKAENIVLDLDALMKYKKVYVKLWIPPFYNLYNINKNKVGHKNPPHWFNKIILSAMIDIYKSWEQKLKELGEPYYLKIWLYDPDFINSQIVAAIDHNVEYYENLSMIDIYKSWEQKLKELGEPYYLKIWLYDPDFINSQIVAAIDHNVEYYENLFEKEEGEIKFPSNKYKFTDNKILHFDWECYKDQYVVFQSEHLDDQAYLEYLNKISYKIQEEQILGQNEICYYVKEGNVWGGALKE